MSVFKFRLRGILMNVMLIDDHPMVNSGLASILEETGRFTVIRQVNSLFAAKKFIEENAVQKNNSSEFNFPFLIILDILLGEENGLDFLPFIKNFCQSNRIPPPYVLVCSVLEEPFRIQTALKKGASGFISKAGNKNELLEAIDSVLRGETYISGIHSDKVMKSNGLYAKFTKREMEIFTLIKEKKSNKQIADELKINLRTVENRISNIYFKTGTANREELLKL